MAARPSWQGHLRLSLVTCPVAMFNAVSPRGDVRFNLINPETGNRIRMVTIDAGTEEPVERGRLVKGYEIAKGEYVTMTQEEIDAVRLESTRVIDIDSFAPADEIDRLYWDNPYYVIPDGKMAAEPFAVIKTAMEKAGMIALGRVVMSQRERLIALEPRGDGLVATTLRMRDEVRNPAAYFSDAPSAKPDADMVAIAEKIIAQKEAPFDPDTFEDRYEEALRALIEEKQRGRKIVRPEEPAPTNVVDLMEALRASLRGEGRAPARRAAAERTRPRKAVAPRAGKARATRAKRS